MPAGTKLIAGNKPVSFVTAQQFQQLQQQGQATQVGLYFTFLMLQKSFVKKLGFTLYKNCSLNTFFYLAHYVVIIQDTAML